jgi:hypothetical protein
MSEYVVEGYGAAARNPEYDGPYLDGHRFDPAIQFAFAGDPEKQAELQKVIDDTEGTPVLAPGGVVTIVTGKDEPNVVVLTKEPDETRTIVLQETEVDKRNKEQQEAELESVEDPNATGSPEGTVDLEQDDVPRSHETRDGDDYNPTVSENRNSDDNTIEQRKDESSSGITLS